ncbi:MAG: hypothetical protein D6753_06125, partial [Planctomycetota bacterium]
AAIGQPMVCVTVFRIAHIDYPTDPLQKCEPAFETDPPAALSSVRSEVRILLAIGHHVLIAS